MAWTCPDCKRSFGAKGRGHMCQPGITLEHYFASARPEAKPIFEAVNAHLVTLDGDLIVDPLSKMIRFKNGPNHRNSRIEDQVGGAGVHLATQDHQQTFLEEGH